MPLFLITGLPGSGKSTVWIELKSRGFEAYDADKDHLASWYNKKTGLPTSRKGFEESPEFLENHSRDISRQTVEELVSKAQDKVVFLCGDPANEDELRDLFSGIFALVVDEDTRAKRLATRTDNNWGKYPIEIEYSLRFLQKARDTYQKYNYPVLDATQPPKDIADRIEQLVASK
jgi:shikimate kinase